MKTIYNDVTPQTGKLLVNHSQGRNKFINQGSRVIITVVICAACVQVRQAAAGFVEAHGRTLERVLTEAASTGAKGWQPGEAELEAAALVLQLLARLVPYHQKHPSSTAIDLRLKAYQYAPDISLHFPCQTACHSELLTKHWGGSVGGRGLLPKPSR